MKYRKLAADCNLKLMNMVKKASEREHRSVSNFIRLAVEEKARKIMGENK